MDSHITGPFKSGYGALVSQRGKVINFDTPSGDYELGEIQASEENPVVAEFELVNTEASDGVGTAIALNYKTGAGPVTPVGGGASKIPFTANTRVYVTFTEGTGATAGHWVAVLRAAGLGQLPVTA